MTITVGASTPAGTYPITVTGNGGGIQQNTTVTLTVIASSAWAIGFDFRDTLNYVTDPPGDTYVLPTTAYPTNFNGVNFGWTNVTLIQARDRNNQIDPRLAGMNFASNGSPGTFYVDLPASGTYNVSLALGDAGYQSCTIGCQIQFLDGSTVLRTIAKGSNNSGYFYDAQGNNWSAAKWPTNNVSLEVAIAGSRLTMVVGSSQGNGDYTPVAFLGVTAVTLAPNFLLSASPASLSVQQGNKGTSTIATSISGGFNSPITLSASGVPSGTTVSFNPNPIPAPGAGTSTMTVTVGSGTPTGTYPITVTGKGEGVQQNTTVMLQVTPTDFILTARSAKPDGAARDSGEYDRENNAARHLQQRDHFVGCRNALGHHSQFQSKPNPCAGGRNVGDDDHGGSEHRTGYLSDNGDRQRRRTAAQFHRDPDGGFVSVAAGF